MFINGKPCFVAQYLYMQHQTDGMHKTEKEIQNTPWPSLLNSILIIYIFFNSKLN